MGTEKAGKKICRVRVRSVCVAVLFLSLCLLLVHEGDS